LEEDDEVHHHDRNEWRVEPKGNIDSVNITHPKFIKPNKPCNVGFKVTFFLNKKVINNQ
jgi:hypothetical protein